MAYIGKTPVIGNFVKLDAISVVNGQASYTMQNGGANFTEYSNVNQFLVSLNGILQSPTDSFTVASSTITFASNLVTGDVIDFIIVLGNSLDVGVPSDNTVSTAKLQDSAVTTAKLNDASVSLAKLTATGTKDATTFLRGDNTFAEAGGGGKVLQAKHYSFSTRSSIASSVSDTELKEWTTSFVKQSATSNLYIWNIMTFHSIGAGASQTMVKFIHSDSTTTEVFGARLYPYAGTSNSTHMSSNSVATGLKTGTYTIKTFMTSNGNSSHGSTVINPNGSEDARYEFSSDAQTATGTAGSKSILMIQEIEV